MDCFESLTGIAAPLLRPNIDTDTIAPGVARQESSPTPYGDNLFHALRFVSGREENPDFILNKPGYREAKILLAGNNFGCGSSRESAVWSLKEFGISCVIAPSFAEIFYGNCFKNGVLPVVLSEDAISSLAEQAGNELTVDLTMLTLTTSIEAIEFTVPEFRRRQLLEGVNEIEFTLGLENSIKEFQEHDKTQRPWIYFNT